LADQQSLSLVIPFLEIPAEKLTLFNFFWFLLGFVKRLWLVEDQRSYLNPADEDERFSIDELPVTRFN